MPDGALVPSQVEAVPVEGAGDFVFCAREGILAKPSRRAVSPSSWWHRQRTKEQDGSEMRYAITCDKRCEASTGAYRNTHAMIIAVMSLKATEENAKGIISDYNYFFTIWLSDKG